MRQLCRVATCAQVIWMPPKRTGPMWRTTMVWMDTWPLFGIAWTRPLLREFAGPWKCNTRPRSRRSGCCCVDPSTPDRPAPAPCSIGPRPPWGPTLKAIAPSFSISCAPPRLGSTSSGRCGTQIDAEIGCSVAYIFTIIDPSVCARISISNEVMICHGQPVLGQSSMFGQPPSSAAGRPRSGERAYRNPQALTKHRPVVSTRGR